MIKNNDNWGNRRRPRRRPHQTQKAFQEEDYVSFEIDRRLNAKNAVSAKKDNKLTGAKLFSSEEYVRYGVRKRERRKGSLTLMATPVYLFDELELSPSISGEFCVLIKQRH